jgi:hypothetical protein
LLHESFDRRDDPVLDVVRPVECGPAVFLERFTFLVPTVAVGMPSTPLRGAWVREPRAAERRNPIEEPRSGEDRIPTPSVGTRIR